MRTQPLCHSCRKASDFEHVARATSRPLVTGFNDGARAGCMTGTQPTSMGQYEVRVRVTQYFERNRFLSFQRHVVSRTPVLMKLEIA